MIQASVFNLGRVCLGMIAASGSIAEITADEPAPAPVVERPDGARAAKDPVTVRVATYNVSLYGDREGGVADRIAGGGDDQACRLAAVIRTVRPDVMLINEIDYDAEGRLAELFNDEYLNASEGCVSSAIEDASSAKEPIDFPHRYVAATNTGEPSGMDLNDDGDTDDPQDAHGFGRYPGQYGFAIFSRHPIDVSRIRTFQRFRWSDLPEAKRPGVADRFSDPDERWRKLRLSSKNHIDVPIRIGDQTLHLLASHPTPPVFDGPEDRNGRRNADEIRFWSLYLDGSGTLVDDAGVAGGLPEDRSFVIAGDLNSDPNRGDSIRAVIAELLSHRRVSDPRPTGANGVDTAPFNGGMRVDYVLPGGVEVERAGVFDNPIHADWITATDHRLVWVDIRLRD